MLRLPDEEEWASPRSAAAVEKPVGKDAPSPLDKDSTGVSRYVITAV